MSENVVTCSFTMDRKTYNAYKSIISLEGETVKGDLVKYMQNVIEKKTLSSELFAAKKEIEQLKENPNKKSYDSFAELLSDLENE